MNFVQPFASYRPLYPNQNHPVTKDGQVPGNRFKKSRRLFIDFSISRDFSLKDNLSSLAEQNWIIRAILKSQKILKHLNKNELQTLFAFGRFGHSLKSEATSTFFDLASELEIVSTSVFKPLAQKFLDSIADLEHQVIKKHLIVLYKECEVNGSIVILFFFVREEGCFTVKFKMFRRQSSEFASFKSDVDAESIFGMFFGNGGHRID